MRPRAEAHKIVRQQAMARRTGIASTRAPASDSRMDLLRALEMERDPPLTHDELRMLEGSMRGAYNHKLAGHKAGER